MLLIPGAPVLCQSIEDWDQENLRTMLSGKLQNYVNAKGFEQALAMILITSAIFFAWTTFVDTIHLMNWFTKILPKL